MIMHIYNKQVPLIRFRLLPLTIIQIDEEFYVNISFYETIATAVSTVSVIRIFWIIILLLRDREVNSINKSLIKNPVIWNDLNVTVSK